MEYSESTEANLGLYDINHNELIPLFSTDINEEIYDKFSKRNLSNFWWNWSRNWWKENKRFKKNIEYKYVEKVKEGASIVSNEEINPSSTKVKVDLLITKLEIFLKKIFSFIHLLDISLSKNLKFVLPLVLTPRFIQLQKTLELLKNFITTKNYGDKKIIICNARKYKIY